MPVPRSQTRVEDDLFLEPGESEDLGAQQTRQSTLGGRYTIGGPDIPPNMETEEDRAERGRIARENVQARLAASLGEDAASAGKVESVWDQAIESGVLTEVSVSTT
jgi:hypothetical protein